MPVNAIDLFILVIVLFSLYFVYTNTDTLENVVKQTIFGSTNPFTGLFCVSDDLPIIRTVETDSGTTFQCISRNGTDCMKRADLLTPDFLTVNQGKDAQKNDIVSFSPVVCDVDLNMSPCRDNFAKIQKPSTFVNNRGRTVDSQCTQFNKYITQNAVRNPQEPPNAIFRELDSNSNAEHKYFTCTQKGLQDPTHWCGKVHDKLKTTVCAKRDILQGPLFTNVCKQVPKYAATQATTEEPVLVNTNEEIRFLKRVDMCKKRFCTINRSKDMTMDQCQQNCDICADTTCT